MKETKIEIEIPDGKMAKWVNGVLTLVDDKKQQNVMERIKTFDDALAELRDRAEHGDEEAEVLVNEYDNVYSICIKCSKDLLAYLKLRIITYALNEGWEPKFISGEYRWAPYFILHTKEEIENMNAEVMAHIVFLSGYENAYCGVSCAVVDYNSDYLYMSSGSRLAFKSKELAEYAGNQFTKIYADFIFKAKK